MNDSDLQDRFVELREEERRSVRPFRRLAREPVRSPRWRLAVVFALFAIIVAGGVQWRRASRHEPAFSASERAAARTLSAWRAPTDSLLHTTSRDLVTTVPHIPSAGVKGGSS